MGGYVSLVVAEQVDAKGVFLLAPALFMPGYKKQSYLANTNNIEIVHGWSDDIIPVDNSIKFAKGCDCSLHLISGDHRLNSSLPVVEKLFVQFLLSLERQVKLGASCRVKGPVGQGLTIHPYRVLRPRRN